MNLQDLVGSVVQNSPSAAGNWLQFKLLSISKGHAELSVIVREEMTNPYKHIHGGMMALVIDESIGWAVLSIHSEFNYTTLNLNIDYLYAIKAGEELIAKSSVVRAGKKIINVTCSVWDKDGRILAKASSNLISTGMQRPRMDEEAF